MKLRPRKPPAKSSAAMISPIKVKSKKKQKTKEHGGRSSWSKKADEWMAMVAGNEEGEDDDVMDIDDANSLFEDELDDEEEIQLILELCMRKENNDQQISSSKNAGEGAAATKNEENSDPNVPISNKAKNDKDDSTEALLNIELGELDGILSPSSMGIDGRMAEAHHYDDDFRYYAPPLEIHEHSAFAPYPLMHWIPPPIDHGTVQPSEPCPRCEYWHERMDQFENNFIYKLKQSLDQSVSEYFHWNPDGLSFNIQDHDETDEMLVSLFRAKTAMPLLPKFRCKIVKYGFKAHCENNKSSYYHPWFRRESTLDDLLWIIEVQKSTSGNINGSGLWLHRGCHFAHRDLHAIPPPRMVVPCTPLSSPVNDSSMDEIIAEILSEVFLDANEEESSSSSSATIYYDAMSIL